MSDETAQTRQAPATTASIGKRYLDNHGRILTITEIEPDNHLERHVRGLIGRVTNGTKPVPYATSLQIFEDTWSPE